MKSLSWLNPWHSFATKLTVIIVSLIVLTLAGATLVTLRATQSHLTGQVGENFEGDAASVGKFVGLFLYSNVTELQQLAAAQTVREAAAQRNDEYQGQPYEILPELLTLDEHWRAAPDHDPLIRLGRLHI